MEKFEFIIIAGELKGKKITAPNLGITRPPLSRLRRAIFDFLVPHLIDGDYLDLFSGTGSYLFEAVSRGVKSATGIEMEPKLAHSINSQATKLAIDDRLVCHCNDVFEAIPSFVSSGTMFDIVMIAPPQYVGMMGKTLEKLLDNKIVRPGGMILCQHDTSETNGIDFSSWTIEQSRKYGNTTYTILRV